METPANLQELVDCVRGSTGRLEVVGAGTKAGWGGRVDVDHRISTRGLSGVIEHDPGDLTARFWAGTPLSEVQASLRYHGQWLPLDPEHAERATLGGIFATNDAGPLRTGFGTLRDTAIGSTVVLSDGTVSRSGGRVIKNVAGYDLTRLFSGSCGTLGAVADLTVRVLPLPEHSQTVGVDATAEDATDWGLALLASPLEPVAADYVRGRCYVRFMGTEASVVGQADRWCDELSGREIVRWSGAEEAAGWAELRPPHQTDGRVRVRVMARPSDFADIMRILKDCIATAWVHSHLCLGVSTVFVPIDAAGAVVGLRRVQDVVERFGGALTVLDAAPDGWSGVGTHPPAAPLMRRVRDALDPDARWAPGRLRI